MEIYVLLYGGFESDGYLIDNQFVAAGRTAEGLVKKAREHQRSRSTYTPDEEDDRIYMPDDSYSNREQADSCKTCYRIIKETVLE